MKIDEGVHPLLQVAAAVLVLGAAQFAIAQEPAPATGLDAMQPVVPSPLNAAGDGERVDLYGDPLPPGAIARLGTIRYRHNGWYKRIAFLPDNATFVVGTANNTIRLWDVASGRPVREIALGDAMLQAFALSPDGERLVVLAAVFDRQMGEYEMRLKVWELTTWNEQAAFKWTEPLLEASKSVALSPDGTLAATGTSNGKIRFWDLASGQERFSHDGMGGEIESIEFSPGGELIAAAGRRGAVLWEWGEGNEPIRLPELPRGGQVVRFSPDGNLLTVGSDDTVAAQLYDVPSGKLNRKLQGLGERYYREGLSFLNGGQQLATPAYPSSIEIFDVATGQLARTLDVGIDQPRGIAISSDDRVAAIIASEAEIKVWDLQADKSLSNRFVGHTETPYEIFFLPGGREIATGAVDGTIRIWESNTGEPQQVLRHERWVTALAATRDGSRILSSGMDDSLRLWDVAAEREIYKLAGHGRTGGNRHFAVGFSEDESAMLSFGPDLYLRIFDVATGKALAEHAIRPSSIELEEADEGRPRLKEGEAFGGLDEDASSAIGSARFSANGSMMFLSTRRGALHIFDVTTGREFGRLEADRPLQEYAVSRTGALLATASRKPPADGNPDPAMQHSLLHLQRTSEAEPLWEKELPGNLSYKLEFSPNGEFVAVSLFGQSPRSGSRYWISVLSSATGDEIYRIEDYPQGSNNFTFSPDSRRLAASYPDTSVIVWDLPAFRVSP